MFSQNKNKIRQDILAIRNNLSQMERHYLQHLISERFNQLIFPLIKNATTIASYYPIASELDCLSILEGTSSKLLLPVMNSSSKILKFYPWKSSDKMILSKHTKYILEPLAQRSPVIPDVVIAPLIACDQHGNRIGSGKAMYDNTISQLRIQNPQLIYMALCYDLQLLEEIPTEIHDQKLDIILTELRIIIR